MLKPPNYTSKFPQVGIIGVGRLGSALFATFNAQGLPFVYCDSQVHPKLTEGISLEEVVLGAELIFLCVQDDAILTVGREIAAIALPDQNKKTLVVLSGAFHLGNLNFMENEVWTLVKLHPLQSFTSRDFRIIPPNTPFAIQVAEKHQGFFSDLVKSWDGKPHFLEADAWSVYHLAAVLSANFLPLLIRSGVDILNALTEDSQASADWLKPLIERSVRQALDTDVEKPFSGPAARGDKGVMEQHQKWLAEHMPEMSGIYREISDLIAKKS